MNPAHENQGCEKPACLRHFAVVVCNGEDAHGYLRIAEKGLPTQQYNWHVVPTGVRERRVIGDGALLACGTRVPNKEQFPFSIDPHTNALLKQYILGKVIPLLTPKLGGEKTTAAAEQIVNPPALSLEQISHALGTDKLVAKISGEEATPKTIAGATVVSTAALPPPTPPAPEEPPPKTMELSLVPAREPSAPLTSPELPATEEETTETETAVKEPAKSVPSNIVPLPSASETTTETSEPPQRRKPKQAVAAKPEKPMKERDQTGQADQKLIQNVIKCACDHFNIPEDEFKRGSTRPHVRARQHATNILREETKQPVEAIKEATGVKDVAQVYQNACKVRKMIEEGDTEFATARDAIIKAVLGKAPTTSPAVRERETKPAKGPKEAVPAFISETQRDGAEPLLEAVAFILAKRGIPPAKVASVCGMEVNDVFTAFGKAQLLLGKRAEEILGLLNS